MIADVLSAGSIGAAGVIAYQLSRDSLRSRRVHRRARQQVGLLAPDDPRSRNLVGWVTDVMTAESVVKKRRRSEELANQLGPALQLMIGHLRIGGNVLSSLAEVSEVSPDPLKSLLREVVAEARLGSPVEDVFQRIAEREGDRHLGIVASAIGLHARHGGSLVEILDSVTETIEEEDRLRRDIRSATADGRLSAMVLLAMPPLSLALVSLLSPGYASPLVTEPLGRAMSVVAVVLGVTGWRWLRILGNPKVAA